MKQGGALFIALVSLFVCGCRHKRVKLSVVTVPQTQQTVVCADPDPVLVKPRSGKFTITWKIPTAEAWMIQFTDSTPCKDTIIQSGQTTTTCVITDSSQMKDKYKYYALVGGAISEDPGIVHDVRQKPAKATCPSNGAQLPHESTQKTVTLFCLDLTGGSPVSCKNGDHPLPNESPNPLQNVSPQDDIYFKLNPNSTITIDNGICNQGQTITTQQGYCTVATNPVNCCTYNYKLNGSGNYQIIVNKP